MILFFISLFSIVSTLPMPLGVMTSAVAADQLPYATRTQSYSGWNTSVHGNIRTIGMGGATSALGDSFIASTENPAGLAMTFEGMDLNYSESNIQDGNLQNYQTPISLTSGGIAVNHYPWGFSIGGYTPYQEKGSYLVPGAGTTPIPFETRIHEFRLGVSRLIDLKSRTLALGLASISGSASEAMGSHILSQSNVGWVGSAMIQLPKRYLIGLSYQFPMNYNAPVDGANLPVAGFFQPVLVPSRISLGVGWIPNRIFRAGVTLNIVGATPNSALLSNNQTPVGEYTSYQPRMGISYTAADFPIVQSKVYLGSYIENSRIPRSGRLHFTLGVESRLWFVNLGFGTDISANYLNKSVSVGLDVLKIMNLLDLIPREWHPPYAGFLPDPTAISDIGLSRPLVEHWVPHGKPLDPIQVGLDLPNRVEKKLEEIKNEFGSLSLRSEKPSPLKKEVPKKTGKNTKERSLASVKSGKKAKLNKAKKRQTLRK